MAARAEDLFDWRNPDYAPIYAARNQRLEWLRKNPCELVAVNRYYRTHIADFINDWGLTYDPRNVGTKRPAFLPFLLQPKQRELVDWMIEAWHMRETRIVEKSRDVGVSWVAMAVAIGLCVFWDNVSIGFGSATEPKLDRSGDPDSLFWKGRMFVQYLPEEFRGGCNILLDAPDKRILFPKTGSSITGEVGDKIGHGGRKTLYGVDEASHLEHPLLVSSGLSGTTDCRIDFSSVSLDGMANDFAVRRHSGNFKVFTYHYRDDLRKDDEWREKKKASLDPTVWAANYEIDYTAAAEGVLIPQLWVQSAIDAHKKLGITPTGAKRGALDVADMGRDVNCFGACHGMLVTHCVVWPGEASKPLFATVERAYLLTDQWDLDGFDYDAEGMGAGVRSDVYRIQQRRQKEANLKPKIVRPFRASGALFKPESTVEGTDRKAEDMFQNLKAQTGWMLRQRFQETHRAVNGATDYDHDKIIAIDSSIPDVQKLCIEISQPQWKVSANGKIVIDKTPEGAMSPNRADMVFILYHPRRRGLNISEAQLEEL